MKQDGLRQEREDGSIELYKLTGHKDDGTLLGAMPAVFRDMNVQQATNFIATIRGQIGAQAFDEMVANARGEQADLPPKE